MGVFEALKATINANIGRNGNREITGEVMNNVLIESVNITESAINEIKESNVVLSEKEYDELAKKDESKYYFVYEEE